MVQALVAVSINYGPVKCALANYTSDSQLSPSQSK